MQKTPFFLRFLTVFLILVFTMSLLASCGAAEIPSTDSGTGSEQSGLFPDTDSATSEPEEDDDKNSEEDPVSEQDPDSDLSENSSVSDTSSEEDPEDEWDPGNDDPNFNPEDLDKPKPPSLGYTVQTSVAYVKLGLRGKDAESSNENVAKATAYSNAVGIYGYSSGTATITVTDYFGFTATIDVTVDTAARKITCTPKKCTQDFIEVGMDFGAKGNGSTDDTEAFQKALNSAKAGETVYVYPGRYPVSLLTMPEGVTLRMYTTMTDAKEGFSEQIKNDFNARKIAILSGTRILNCEDNTPGRDGNSNFKIIGGAIDTNQRARSAVIFGNAKNVSVENMIFKDMKNTHVIQLTGCENATVKNCMFAGFVCGDTFTRETIQVEPSHPGATSTTDTPPITFDPGEYFLPKDITITDCYFGESDEAGAPLIAIGHHSQVGKANVTNFKITNNVFDECLYAAIRYHNLVDAEITGNTFRSTSKYMNATQYTKAVDPAFIQLYHTTKKTSYKDQNGTTVIRATEQEQAGLHNVRIENNTFEVGEGSDKKIIRYVGNDNKPGGFYTTGNRQDSYLGETYALKGYRPVNNFASDITFKKNTITFKGKPTYKDWYVSLDPIYGLTFSDNTVNLNGLSFSKGENGQVIESLTAAEQRTFTVAAANTSKTIKIVCGSKTYTFTASATATLTFKMSAGGALPTVTASKTGNLTITLNPKSGYTFDKITNSSDKAISTSTTVSSSTTYNVLFSK